jgi:hypothetical protein
MPKKLLDLLQRHPAFQERRGYRMAEEMRIHALGDPRVVSLDSVDERAMT